MLASVAFLSDEAPWPGYLALIPTVGCALVIASPGANLSRVLLGNRVAQFFGLISYPLYLWHWPLLSIGPQSRRRSSASLADGGSARAFRSPCLSDLDLSRTPCRLRLQKASDRHCGVLARGPRSCGPAWELHPRVWRHPATLFAARPGHFQICRNRRPEGKVEVRGKSHQDIDTLEVARAKARAFYAENELFKARSSRKADNRHAGRLSCSSPAPRHGDRLWRSRQHCRSFMPLGCAPLIAQTDWPRGIIGSTRCKAINEEVFRNIVALKPAAIIVGAYYAGVLRKDTLRYFPSFLEDFDANVSGAPPGGRKFADCGHGASADLEPWPSQSRRPGNARGKGRERVLAGTSEFQTALKSKRASRRIPGAKM